MLRMLIDKADRQPSIAKPVAILHASFHKHGAKHPHRCRREQIDKCPGKITPQRVHQVSRGRRVATLRSPQPALGGAHRYAPKR